MKAKYVEKNGLGYIYDGNRLIKKLGPARFLEAYFINSLKRRYNLGEKI